MFILPIFTLPLSCERHYGEDGSIDDRFCNHYLGIARNLWWWRCGWRIWWQSSMVMMMVVVITIARNLWCGFCDGHCGDCDGKSISGENGSLMIRSFIIYNLVEPAGNPQKKCFVCYLIVSLFWWILLASWNKMNDLGDCFDQSQPSILRSLGRSRGAKTWVAGKQCYLESYYACGKFLHI